MPSQIIRQSISIVTQTFIFRVRWWSLQRNKTLPNQPRNQFLPLPVLKVCPYNTITFVLVFTEYLSVQYLYISCVASGEECVAVQIDMNKVLVLK